MLVRGLQVKASRRRGLHASRRTRWQHVREMVWPSMGVLAWCRWLGYQLARQAGKPHGIALGFAIGVWISFFPVLGTHLILAFLLCILTRSSMLAATAGSFIGNPWTYGLMWWSGYETGVFVLRMVGVTVPHVDISAMLREGLELSTLRENASVLIQDVLLPTAFGGTIVGTLVGLVFYALVYVQVRRWRMRRVQRLLAKRAERHAPLPVAA